MWPAIATVCLAAITLLGYIAQRNFDFYKKISNFIFYTSLASSACISGYLYGHNDGIRKAMESVGSLNERAELSLLKFDGSLFLLFCLLPFAITIIIGVIGYVARQIQPDDKSN